jgi:demethylmenaquinone methyltransferase/2-methoxy-6-polyprenyl-1,4-benzoquinol methylase
MTKFNHFDFLAPIYERFIRPIDPSRLSSLVGLPITGQLLDAGGGTGRISYALRQWVGGIVVVDSSIGMLEQAKSKAALHTVCSNTEKLPFHNEIFERVIMVDALHHVSDITATLDELWRVVKPGGRIVIEEPDIHTYSVKFLALIEKLTLMRSHFVSPQNIQNAFDDKNASHRIISEGMTSWIIVDKPLKE